LRPSAIGVYSLVLKPQHTVVETPEFLRQARGVLSDDERAALVDWLAAHPTAGDVMVGTGGARKFRWAARGKGKSGGVRAVTYYSGLGVPVFLLSVFGKHAKANLAPRERNELRTILATLVQEYRKGASRRVKGR
jgi:hypothetical protein